MGAALIAAGRSFRAARPEKPLITGFPGEEVVEFSEIFPKITTDLPVFFTWQGAISAAEIFMGRSLFQSDSIYADFDIVQAFAGVVTLLPRFSPFPT